MEKRLLEGVVVLDLTRVLAGPYCGMFLSDMGATVYKIETPKVGDDSRAMGPFVTSGDQKDSAYYIGLNRGKLGLTLNLKAEEGKDLFKELVKKADILIENYRPGTMEKLGLGYDVLKEINPKLVYGAVSGFGHTGRLSRRAGYDIVGQAVGGLMSTTGWPGGAPTRTGTPMGDVLGGLNLAIGVLAALYNAKMTGVGEKVDVALADSVVSAMANINMIYLNEGRIPDRIGNRYESTYPYDSFETKEAGRWFIVGAGNQKLFGLLCDLMGQPDLIKEERFSTVAGRVAAHEELKEIVNNWTKKYTVEELDEMFDKAGIPGSPINNVKEVTEHGQIAEDRNMFPVLHQPVGGDVRVTNNALKFTNTTADPVKPSSLLGEYNEDIYMGLLGLSKERYEELKEKGVF